MLVWVWGSEHKVSASFAYWQPVLHDYVLSLVWAGVDGPLLVGAPRVAWCRSEIPSACACVGASAGCAGWLSSDERSLKANVLKMSESAVRDLPNLWLMGVWAVVYEDNFSMGPSDTRKVEKLHHKVHGIRGHALSVNCTYLPWVNCPVAHQGQFYVNKKANNCYVKTVSEPINKWQRFLPFGRSCQGKI